MYIITDSLLAIVAIVIEVHQSITIVKIMQYFKMIFSFIDRLQSQHM